MHTLSTHAKQQKMIDPHHCHPWRMEQTPYCRSGGLAKDWDIDNYGGVRRGLPFMRAKDWDIDIYGGGRAEPSLLPAPRVGGNDPPTPSTPPKWRCRM